MIKISVYLIVNECILYNNTSYFYHVINFFFYLFLLSEKLNEKYQTTHINRMQIP